ncbi:VQ motif-containing protein 4-like [Zingiber officinale]|uniref:VQ domain-containing protein n=1 Tax=Zingiber officinale TaxID=94328 RepID=A0A8J5KIP3_ZINOF|nr:VQ motif-containing protein 4-like [Zingiber officinale]KAG6491160.1 hypothetical protein ZIOFF_052493 [Zingiber officinale]
MESSGRGSPRFAASSCCVGVSSGGVRPRFMDDGGCPTTFVQADADSFKRVVQKLTGHGMAAPPGPKKQTFKLYERRGGLKTFKAIRPPAPSIPATLSPSVLDFPSLALASPITPLVPDPFDRAAAAAVAEEERAIAEKGFYLHPPPRSAVEPPRLLSLFPVTSPTTPSASSSP